MNTQYLQYVREQLIVATADLSGATKGQLEAWLEHAQFDTGTYKRKKPRILDEVTGRMITLDNPPISGKQLYAKGSSIALVSQVSSQPRHGAARFCLSKNIRKRGCCGVTAKVFAGNIRSP